MRRVRRSTASATFSISRWWTATSFSQSRRFSYICFRNESASWLSASSSRMVSNDLIASAWFENFSRNRLATRRCSATFSAGVSTAAAFLRSSEIRSGQRFMVSYCAASASAASKLVGWMLRIWLNALTTMTSSFNRSR